MVGGALVDMKYETIKHTYDRDAYADAIWERKSVSELAIRKSSPVPWKQLGKSVGASSSGGRKRWKNRITPLILVL